MFQRIVTPAAGKRLIAKATAAHPDVKKALTAGTVVIIAGTTNGMVAEEILNTLGKGDAFSRDRFFRGVTLPPGKKVTDTGRLPDESEFHGDVVIIDGTFDKGKTIFDAVSDLKAGDVIIKGANAVNLTEKKAGILIGHPAGGTIAAAIQAVVGKRVKLLLPAGLEKRVTDSIDDITRLLNDPSASGARMLPAPGEVITELEAISILTGATAKLVAAGGIGGAEGAVWIAVNGTPPQEDDAKGVLATVLTEPAIHV